MIVSTATYVANAKEDPHCKSLCTSQDFRESRFHGSLKEPARELLITYEGQGTLMDGKMTLLKGLLE